MSPHGSPSVQRPTPARRGGRPRSVAHDRAILAAALRLLARDGFARMSMDAVAAEARVSKATLYLRYRSKSDLATAALARLREEAERPPSGDLRADLVGRMERAISYAGGTSVMPLIGTCLVEYDSTPELLELLRERGIGPRRAALRAIMAAAQERGELRADLDLEAGIDLLMGAYFARHLSGGEVNGGWAESVVDTLLAGMATAPAESGGAGAP
ncbi:MAG TPA: TetR/AcrR family transcriptional regulator [Miltoncostaeaceae bacterium]|nr:TetR/AcrR family transcriptional regulator [Miltoncostaeaceae bacterium]